MSQTSQKTENDLIYRLRHPARSWTHAGRSQLDNEETIRDMTDAADEIERLRGLAPRSGLEPVAWRYRFVTSVDGDWSDWFIVDDVRSIPSRADQVVEPLYAASPDTSTLQSAPVQRPPHNSGERLPSSDAAGAGAGTESSPDRPKD